MMVLTVTMTITMALTVIHLFHQNQWLWCRSWNLLTVTDRPVSPNFARQQGEKIIWGWLLKKNYVIVFLILYLVFVFVIILTNCYGMK